MEYNTIETEHAYLYINKTKFVHILCTVYIYIHFVFLIIIYFFGKYRLNMETLNFQF